MCAITLVQALSAGAAHLILSIVDTNRESVAVVIACVRTLLLCQGQEVVAAAKELRSPATYMQLATRHAQFVEVWWRCCLAV